MLNEKYKFFFWKSVFRRNQYRFFAYSTLSREGSHQTKSFFGTYYFAEDFVTSIERISDSKILIHHIVKEYPSTIEISSKNIFEKIKQVGFSPSAHQGEIKRILPDGQPVKIWIPIIGLFLWTFPFYIPPDNLRHTFFVLIIFFFLVFCVTLFLSGKMQKIVLKPERSFSEIRNGVLLVGFLMSLFFPVIALQPYLCKNIEHLCNKPLS